MLAKLIVPKDNKRFEGWGISLLDLSRSLGLPIIGVAGALNVKLTRATFWFSVVCFITTGLSITVGYHRYWSHRSFNASKVLQYALAIIGAAALQNPILWWAREHRAHHRYTDTDLDPYSAKFGLFWSHFGWFLVEPPRRTHRSGWVDIEDLKKDKIVRWQSQYYTPLTILMGFFVPTIIPGYFWGDWKGGFVYSAVVRMTLVHHATFSINSLAHWHWWGEKTFDNKHTPVDSSNPLVALLTGGESYHNFHHQFPMDYRNGVKWYHVDPSKWLIWGLSEMGLTSQLKTFPVNEIQKAEFTMKLKKLAKVQGRLEWPKDSDDLPVISWESYKNQARNQSLVLIGGFIHDVFNFLEEHPGGAKVIQGFVGKDATPAFFGGVYDHSSAAHNLLAMKRVGVLLGGYETGSSEPQCFVPPSQRLTITSYEGRIPTQPRENIPR